MSKANKAYKFRIYPNEEQKVLFAKTFGCVRFIYNKMLEDKIKHYEETKQNLFSQIEVGQILKGEVVRIADFGAFVDLGGIEGLLPLSQMSWKWVEHPKDVVKLREKIEVEVI